LLAVWLLALWLGGFTFYSAAVIPILHDQLGSPLETGLVTQRATDVLNGIGLVTVALGWTRVLMVRRDRGSALARRRWANHLLALTTAALVVLILIHRVLDRRLETAELSGFYPIHRVYVWVSTIQWLANLGLLASWAGWRTDDAPEEHPENPQVSG
jgi:hypothetical protein